MSVGLFRILVYCAIQKAITSDIMMKNISIDPFPASSPKEKNKCWIYGRAEREALRLQQLINAKDKARLKVGYPGEFMLPHDKIHFRAHFPAGDFPITSVGSPVLTEIHMDQPGMVQFSLSTSVETDIPCFCCNADVLWESSVDGVNWHYTTGIYGDDIPPHRTVLPIFELFPEQLPNGIYDAGREVLGYVCIRNAANAGLYVGESIPEALNRDPKDFEQSLELVLQDDNTLCSAVPLAFRYISLEQAEGAEISVKAIYTPMTLQKRFFSGDRELDAIWERSVYTLHLCTHYFLIDGVKRDRLPWAGDLAVSLLSMTESFMDAAPIRDTLALLGSAGIRNTHINGITDYTLWYLINLNLYETYFSDIEFLRQEYFRVVETAELLLSQRLENGLLPLTGLVLIDWADGDKNCALQILFFIALKALAELACRMDDETRAAEWELTAEALRKKIRGDFYDNEIGLFRCSPERSEFLRHQNFLAILSIATETESRRIAEHLLKDELPAVGTPYMKAFEIMALDRAGFKEEAVQEIRRYWGGMMNVGATTFFEAYGEGKKGKSFYDFYNRPYGLSLCHAWSSAPAFLLPMILRKTF